MPRKPKSPPDDPEESKRFIDMAREVGADEGNEGRKAFERVLDKLAPSKASGKAGSPGASSRRSSRKDRS
jgi:hypothetical protein